MVVAESAISRRSLLNKQRAFFKSGCKSTFDSTLGQGSSDLIPICQPIQQPRGEDDEVNAKDMLLSYVNYYYVPSEVSQLREFIHNLFMYR